MIRSSVRLTGIRINDFKNVANGELSFINPKRGYRASIVGLYGQNGSGKTSLINALSVLKFLMCGFPVPPKYADFISVDSDSSRITYDFSIAAEDDPDVIMHPGKDDALADAETVSVRYEVSLRRRETGGGLEADGTVTEGQAGVEVCFEELSFSLKSENRNIAKNVLISSGEGNAFGPKAKFSVITGGRRGMSTEVLVAKRLALASSRSFVFSPELLGIVRDNCTCPLYRDIFERLSVFGRRELFVIDTAAAGRISLNALPLVIGDGKRGSVVVSLDDGAVVPASSIPTVHGVIDNMNIVLPEIIPGLKIGIREMGSQLLPDGSDGVKFQLVSYKAAKEIALKYESEGIKKIIAILQLLLAVYNNDSITVAVDELDAGVFEYLLGEILRIISEKGKGQLVFTSHNLRPLETLDTGFVAFTTTDPANRYTRPAGTGRIRNLRDYYYRDMVLGDRKSGVYEPTRNAEIALAFREAGEYFDS